MLRYNAAQPPECGPAEAGGRHMALNLILIIDSPQMPNGSAKKPGRYKLNPLA